MKEYSKIRFRSRYYIAGIKELGLAIIILFMSVASLYFLAEYHRNGLGDLASRHYKSPAWVIFFGSVSTIGCLIISVLLFVLYYASNSKELFIEIDEGKIILPKGFFLDKKLIVNLDEITKVVLIDFNKKQTKLKIYANNKTYYIFRRAILNKTDFDHIYHILKRVSLENNS